MLEMGGGHIVTIRKNVNTAQSLADCKNEVNEMIEHFESGMTTHKNTLLHSIVLLGDDTRPFTNITNFEPLRTVTEVANKIIRGIQSGEELIEITIKKNYMGLLIE